MNKKHNQFLIALLLIVILSGTYVYFAHGVRSEAATSDNSLTSSLNTGSPLNDFTSQDDKIASDVAFIDALSLLTKIEIDTTLFTDPSFNMLKDNTVKLAPGVTGRPNPFAPINPNISNTTEVVSSPVTTNQPSQITDKTVVLDGTVNDLAGVTSTYFEYGTTQSLGKVTPGAEKSLIGGFIKKVTNLTPKTTYYFRAVAKINNTIQYGDIISFTTN